MDCNNIEPRLHAYVDAELDPADIRQIEEHLSACAPCSALVARARALKTVTTNPSLRFAAPSNLKAHVAQLAATVPAQAPPPRIDSPSPSKWRIQSLLAVAAVCLIGVGVLWFVLGSMLTPNPDQHVAVAVVDSHIRSLMADHLTDVLSSDKHTVKPWFNGKIDFSPPVIDLAEQGYPLLGGRMEYLDGHVAAGLVYKRDKHVINLFVWPTSKPDADIHFELQRNGYHVLTWIDHGMECWGVSDLQPEHLTDWARTAKSAMDK